MPEGDTIHKLAARIAPMLVGRVLRRVTTQGLERPALAARTVAEVRAVGKHLVITTDDGTEIRTHLGMNGRWRRYAPGDEPSVSPGRASLAVFTDEDTLVCVMARVEISDRRAPMRGAAIARLGPDVLADRFDAVDAAARARAEGARPIGQVLLDQGVAAGIGNVYRSEVLFLERVHPATATAELDDGALAAIYARARALMSQNLGPSMRTTAPDVAGARHYVYGRTGLPCLVCRTAIETAMDASVRRVFWCPRCQEKR